MAKISYSESYCYAYRYGLETICNKLIPLLKQVRNIYELDFLDGRVLVVKGSTMRSPISEKRVGPASGDSRGHWYAGFDDEQFIRSLGGGWYVESREGEFGPFQSLQEVEDFYYKRFEPKKTAN